MKKIISLLLLFTLSFSLSSQSFIGLLDDNYAGVSRIQHQPASIVDSRLKFDIELFGISERITNDFINIDRSVAFDINSFSDTAFQSKYISGNFNGEPKNLFHNLDIRLINFMVPINDRNSFAFGIRVRQFMNIDNMNEDLLVTAVNKRDVPELYGNRVLLENSRQSIHMWAEYAATYGRVLMDEKQHFMKIGATAKLLQGMGAIYLYQDELSYNIIAQDTLVNVYADLKNGATAAEIEDITQFKFFAKPTFGFDFGFVYEWRPNYKDYKYDMDNERDLWMRDKNKYKLRLSASLIDLGRMRYDKKFGSNDYLIDTNLLSLDGWQINSYQDLMDSLNNVFKPEDAKDYFDMPLPTTLNLSIDYKIANNIYVAAGGRFAFFQGTKIYSKASEINNYYISPRWETKYFGVQLPLSYNQYSQFNFGLGARIGPVFLGSGDLLGILGLKDEVQGLNAYASIKIPIYYKAPKDFDKDKVSDKKDNCKKEKGSWENRGCPDSDEDGLINKDDECPYTAGIPEFNGCPDTDKDGVQDKYDECPEVYGDKIYKGCPDTDEDGVIDKLDSCDMVAGLAEFNGCPDTDSDSIPDYLDDCPEISGEIKFNGCPDTDGDGIQDALDLCPKIAGLDSLQGCPYIDTDNDNIQDKNDDCPKIAGPIENNGCPYADTDNDSILDKDDDCPMTPGTVANNGCPEIEEEEQEILNTAFSNLGFESGKSVILSSSYESLDELAKLMKKKPEFKLLIQGHTDNVGREIANMSLSQNRALAVKKYLTDKGIDDDRITAKWFGETQPIAPNDTEEGRAKNRRVELEVVFD